jgi:electron transfer flavoprotein alpha subunit
MPGIVTFAEHRDGKLRRPSLEALAEARRLTATLGGPVTAVVVGPGAEAVAAELAAHGADKVHVFDDPALGAYATEPYARALAQVVTEARPAAVLVPFTAMGKDVAPRAAARLGAGLVSDCVGFTARDGRLEARRPMYSGKAFANVRWEGDPQMATLRPNVFPLGQADPSRKAEVVKGTVDTSSRAKVKEVHAAASGKVELTEAQIVVSGGRGLKGPENFHLIQELADALGAAVGASRAVVDAGWRPHTDQVGQTGKTVSPQLYIAVGISGAIQHLAGMRTSKYIVAINKDPEAPIFEHATYGLVGDLFEIAPKLTEEFKKAL